LKGHNNPVTARCQDVVASDDPTITTSLYK
jgi:hypothetical protein